MREKGVLIALSIILIVLSGSLYAFSPTTRVAQGLIVMPEMDVSGLISANTTWTLAGSPYIVVGNVVVETDVFLTIEPGVVVRFTSGTSLIIDGALVAQGNSLNKISFTSSSATPNPGNWGTIRFRDTSIDQACVIDWAIIEYASQGITLYYSSPRVSNSILRYNIDGVYSESGGIARVLDSTIFNNTCGVRGDFAYSYVGTSEITRSLVANNTFGIQSSSWGGAFTIVESTFSNNTYGISAYSVRILGSDISHNTNGVAANSATILKSIISENTGRGVSPQGWGSYFDYGSFTIRYSTITGNKGNGTISKGSSIIRFSNIYDNTPFDIVNVAPYGSSSADVNATDNWWGTTDTAEIDQHIYDYYDDYNLRKVPYEPILDSPVAIPPITHDLAITDVTATPASVTAGQDVYVDVTVVNQGDFDENATVIAYYDSVQIGKWTPMYGLLQAGASMHASFRWYTWGVKRGDYTISAEVESVPDEDDTADNLFIDGEVSVTGPLISPYASFTYNPSFPSVGEEITFDASNSYDPDGEIVNYAWNYGDDTSGSGKVTKHTYGSSGSYYVILKVTDDDGQDGTTSQYVYVLPSMLVHDVAVTKVELDPTKVIPGDSTTISVTVENQGDFEETFSVTVFYDDTAAALPQTVTDLAAKTCTTIDFSWNTAELPIGDYTIKAYASIVFGEGDIGDNSLTDGTVTLAHRKLSVKLTGEFDYLRMEPVRIRLTALVKDAETLEEVSDAVVQVEIYDASGALWVSALMQEKISDSGIYEWTSAGTIGTLRLLKGVYLVRAGAFFRDGPTTYDILEFHIDPPAEGSTEPLYYVALAAIALTAATELLTRRKQISTKLRHPSRPK